MPGAVAAMFAESEARTEKDEFQFRNYTEGCHVTVQQKRAASVWINYVVSLESKPFQCPHFLIYRKIFRCRNKWE